MGRRSVVSVLSVEGVSRAPSRQGKPGTKALFAPSADCRKGGVGRRSPGSLQDTARLMPERPWTRDVHTRAHVDPTERFSFLSHAAGALAAVARPVCLVLKAEGPLAVTASALYGPSLVLLLTAISLHHAIHPAAAAGHRALHLLDHLSIFRSEEHTSELQSRLHL